MKTLKLLVGIGLGLYLFICTLIFFLQEQLLFLPESLPQNYTFEFNHPFDEHLIEMEDGAEINALHFRQDSSRGLILYFHGNAGNLDRWGGIVEPFAEMGFEVLVVDYRGYGKSTGKKSKSNMLSDADAIYDLAKTLESEGRIILFGRSLGTSFGCYLAGRNQPSKLILETPFYSIQDVANRMFPIFPVAMLLKYDFKNYEYLDQVKTEVFIFHGTEDEVVDYESGIRLFQSLPPKQAHLFTIEGGCHNDLAQFDAYWNAMNQVLDNE